MKRFFIKFWWAFPILLTVSPLMSIYFLFLSFGLVCEGSHVNSSCFGFSSDTDTLDCLMGCSAEE